MIKAPILAPSPPPETTSQILALPLLSQEDAGTRQFEPFSEPRGRQYGGLNGQEQYPLFNPSVCF